MILQPAAPDDSALLQPWREQPHVAAIGTTPVTIQLYVKDAVAMIERAMQAGATLERAPDDLFYGERSDTLRDPFSHRWLIGDHIEDVSSGEMQRSYTLLLSADRETSG